MASTISRPTGEQIAPPPFSYAQAAKGLPVSAAPTATPQSSQAASGTNTPLRDISSSTNASSSMRDISSSTNASLKASLTSEELESTKIAQGEIQGSNGAKVAHPESESGSKSSHANATSSPSSPSFGTASTSTLPKEEDIPLPSNGAANHPWERRQQNSSSTVNTGDKYVEASEGRRGKGKRGQNSRSNKDSDKKEAEKEKEPVKPEAPLVAAPMPTVNIWAQRMEATAKAKPVTATKIETPIVNGIASSAVKPAEQKRRGKTDESEKQAHNGAGKDAGKAQKKSGDVRREEPAGKRSAPRGSRPGEKDEKSAPITLALPPPVADAAAWPTPDTVADEKRKAQEKGAKDEEAVEESSNREKRPKETWTKIPFTPTAVFNTPLPPPRGGARERGNRGGARGGRDMGGRGGHMANGHPAGDKASTSAQANASNEGKDQRGRDSASAGRAASLPPQNSKRASSDEPHANRDQQKQYNAHEKPKQNAPQSAKVEQTPLESGSRRSSIAPVNGAVVDFHPGAEYHQGPRQSRADFSQSEKFNQTNVDSYGQPSNVGRDRRSDSNARSIDGYSGSVGFPQQRGDARAERGGRYRGGRGGQNNFANGQGHLPGAFQNGNGMPMSNGFPARQGPYSPPLNQAQFGTSFAAPTRGRGNRQSMSGNMYGRYAGANGHHMSPIQTGGHMFGYQAMEPMSAPPFNPYVEQLNMMHLVRHQLEYYLSVENLCKDVFLRKHMDTQGFVFISLIASFRRMQKLTQDLELIRAAAESSDKLEYIQGGEDGIHRVRARAGWEQWVLPMESRAPDAKTAGPAQIVRLPVLRQTQDAQLLMGEGAPSFSPNGMEPPMFQPYSTLQNTMPPPPMNGHTNGVAQPHDSSLSAAVPNFAPGLPLATPETLSMESETTFSDEEVECLTVVVGSPSRDRKLGALYRTFSNGSITDEYLGDDKRQDGANGASDGEQSQSSTAEEVATSANSPPILWIKGRAQAAPVTSQVPDRVDQFYPDFRAKAFRNRDASHMGQTDHQMKSLYEFWSHFLIRNFNPKMYSDFHSLALEDAYVRQTNVGLSNLIKFYGEKLNSNDRTIHGTVARHYIEIVKRESGNEERPAFVQLQAAWKNGSIDLKSRKIIDKLVDAQLKEELER